SDMKKPDAVTTLPRDDWKGRIWPLPVWGALGAIFDKFLYKPLKEALSYVEGSVWDAICAAGSAFMIVNLTYTSLCIIRWANRHKNKPPLNRISRFIDRRYPNHWMEKKFCNWRFIDNEI